MEHRLSLLPATQNSRRDVGMGEQHIPFTGLGADAGGAYPVGADRALRRTHHRAQQCAEPADFHSKCRGIGLGNNRMAGLRPWI